MWQVLAQTCLILLGPMSVALRALLSIGFPRQEYWSGLPFPPSEDLPKPAIEPLSLASSALAGGFFTTGATWEAPGQEWRQKKKKQLKVQERIWWLRKG